jgi:hypothetical protein
VTSFPEGYETSFDGEVSETPFVGLTHAEVLAMTFEGERHLVDDLIEVGVLATIAGIPETYKSWLAQSAAVGVARGSGEILGRQITGEGAVGVFWQDDSRRNEAERVQTYARAHETPADLNLRWFLNLGLELPRDIDKLRATIEHFGFVLVVLDSFYNIARVDLRDREAGSVLALVKAEICDRTDCTVLTVDHMGWANDTNRGRLRSYGDVFKGAATRCGIYVDAEGSKLWVEARGNNIRGFKRTPAYWDADALELRLVDTTKKEESEDDLDARVLAFLEAETRDEAISTRAVQRGVEGRAKSVVSALERLKAAGSSCDCGRGGGPWSGRSRVARYWKATIHEDSTASQLFGKQSDAEPSGAQLLPTASHPVGVEAVRAGRSSNGRIPLPGDPDYLAFIVEAGKAGHITLAEYHELERLHKATT